MLRNPEKSPVYKIEFKKTAQGMIPIRMNQNQTLYVTLTGSP